MLPRHRHQTNYILPSSAPTPVTPPSVPPPPVPGRTNARPAQWSPDGAHRVVRRVGRCQDQPATVTPIAVIKAIRT